MTSEGGGRAGGQLTYSRCRWPPALCLLVSGGSLASSSKRVHRTIPFDQSALKANDELDREMEARAEEEEGQPTEGDASQAMPRGRRGSASSSRSSSSASGDDDDEELQAEDAEEDLQTTLEQMKEEHSKLLEQFNDANSASHISPDPSSPPIPVNAHRRIFIVAKSLPLQISIVTGHPTPVGTPAASPLAGPANHKAASASALDEMDTTFNLGESMVAAPPLSASPALPSAAPAHHKRPSLSSPNDLRVPGSSVKVIDGTKFRVDWDDSRSFLSNLRCLLTPKPAAVADRATSTAGAPLPPGLAQAVDDPNNDVTWVGLSSISNVSVFKSPAERTAYEETLRENHCLPVYLDPTVLDNYQSFCKSILWPVLHYLMPTNTNQYVALRWSDYWKGYQVRSETSAGQDEDEACLLGQGEGWRADARRTLSFPFSLSSLVRRRTKLTLTPSARRSPNRRRARRRSWSSGSRTCSSSACRR